MLVDERFNEHNEPYLVGKNIKETRILVSEAVVVLAPHHTCEQNVERSHLDSPLHLETLLDPFAVLLE
jgi:hypothetical protein